ncbi:AraC family transcriptional regulator [Gracilibacillus alcaliphilus]|uniref:AraC family transcriptional regulator n=1 Tax=Gracilibacillus alcaliphilus TaxID=1401441 RepID=UPI00195D35B2|nr:helix-turn-helix domain-containing protein [Gracilibacillus alcaliphilus]MBM7679006.1 AraC-like DNA-binding protein [Gracilibacillus alcaliphilus]
MQKKLLLISYRLQGHLGEAKAHSHQEYEIYFFHEGTCRYLIHNQIYDLQPGDILLMDGLALHKPNVPSDSSYIRSHIHFSPDMIRPLLKTIGAESLLDVFSQLHHCLFRSNQTEMIQRVESLFQAMAKVYANESMSVYEKEWELKLLIAQILLVVNRLGKQESHKKAVDKYEKAQHAENIATFIQKHFHQKLSIQIIADALNVSKFYVSHVFKEMTGYTVMEYVMAVRLQQVKYLLEAEAAKPIQQIADACGFESASHFSRFFKNSVGMTARQYRQERLAIYHLMDRHKPK